MADWFVRINVRKLEEGSGLSTTLPIERKLYYGYEDKKAVIQAILKDFPEYFPNGKVAQRSANGEFFFINIFELDEYWKSHWEKPVYCSYCKEKSISRIESSNYGVYPDYFCSDECKNRHSSLVAMEDFRSSNTEYFGFIYKITHKGTGKVYIGKTINLPFFRWFQHFKAGSSSRFHEEVRNSSISDWLYEVIDMVPKEEGSADKVLHGKLLALESQYIKEYDSTNVEKGYNTRE